MIEPEVCFRIVHAAQDTHSGAPVAACRELPSRGNPKPPKEPKVACLHGVCSPFGFRKRETSRLQVASC